MYIQFSSFCNAVLCCAVLCCAALRCAELCCAVLCCAVLCCAVLCRAVVCCTVLCCAVLCCAVLGCAVLCCAALRRAELCCAGLRCALRPLEEKARTLFSQCIPCEGSAFGKLHMECVNVDCPIVFRRFQVARELVTTQAALQKLSLDW